MLSNKLFRSLLGALALLAFVAAGSARAQTYPYGFPVHDPCGAAANPVNSVLVNQGGAATTQLVAAPTQNSAFGPNTLAQIFVCGYQFTATGTYQFTYGTGTNCGTGTTNITGAMVTVASPAVNQSPQFEGAVIAIPAGNALCITSGAAATGWVFYAVQ